MLNNVRLFYLVALSLMLPLLTGCSGLKVHADYNHDSDFSAYHTYAWATPASMVDRKANPLSDSDIFEQRLKRLVNTAVQSQGFSLVDADSADFLIAYATQVKVKVRSTPSTSFAYGYGYYGGLNTVVVSDSDVRSYDEGSLLIEFIDRKQDKTVWHTWTSAILGSAKKNRENLGKVVPRMMAMFPPAPESE